jgi:hypothetical protein
VPAILDLELLKELVVLAGWVIGSDTLLCRKLSVETPCSRLWSWPAINALHAISQWPEGVAVLADLDVLGELQHINHANSNLHKLRQNITRYKAGNPDSAHQDVDLWQRDTTYL